ncbi:hypothetical protein HYT33_04160 [Candidatus Roizmanbacteria bacterium]|nr:hypothetical protein [Candidatus Roizmanbacteria bacterium]
MQLQPNYTPIDDLILASQNGQGTVGALRKELEPAISQPEHLEIKKVVEYVPDAEVSPYIKHREEIIRVPKELEEMEVHAKETPIFPTFENIPIPISDEKIVQGLHKPITSSFRWLAELALYLLRKMHIALKVIHGKVTRIPSR